MARVTFEKFAKRWFGPASHNRRITIEPDGLTRNGMQRYVVSVFTDQGINESGCGWVNTIDGTVVVNPYDNTVLGAHLQYDEYDY